MHSYEHFNVARSKDPSPLSSASQSSVSTRATSPNPSTPSNHGLHAPRPIYQRPDSYGQKSSNNCTHCGNVTPRYGSTTLYGTPLGNTPATSTDMVHKFSNHHNKVSILAINCIPQFAPITFPICGNTNVIDR